MGYEQRPHLDLPRLRTGAYDGVGCIKKGAAPAGGAAPLILDEIGQAGSVNARPQSVFTLLGIVIRPTHITARSPPGPTSCLTGLLRLACHR